MAGVTHPSPSLLPGSRALKTPQLRLWILFQPWGLAKLCQGCCISHPSCISLGSHNLLLLGISRGGGCGLCWFLLFLGIRGGLQVLQGVLGQQFLPPCPWGIL